MFGLVNKKEEIKEVELEEIVQIRVFFKKEEMNIGVFIEVYKLFQLFI